MRMSMLEKVLGDKSRSDQNIKGVFWKVVDAGGSSDKALETVRKHRPELAKQLAKEVANWRK